MARYSLFFSDGDTLIVVNTLQPWNDFVGSCDILVSLHQVCTIIIMYSLSAGGSLCHPSCVAVVTQLFTKISLYCSLCTTQYQMYLHA